MTHQAEKNDSWVDKLIEWADKNDIPQDQFPRDKEEIVNLTELDLNSNYLTELPAEIGNLTNLTYLSLSDNKLTELPAEIGNLTNLTKLRLGWNKLTKLPAEIGNLTNLTELNLTSNKLKKLPKEIGNLTNLTELDLNHNNLTELPAEIGNLTNLTKLNLWENKLKKLPKEIGNLVNLTELNLLMNNNLTELPAEIGNLIKNCKIVINDEKILEKAEKEFLAKRKKTNKKGKMKYKITISGSGMFLNRYSVNEEGEEFLREKIENEEIEELCGNIWGEVPGAKIYFSDGGVCVDGGNLVVVDDNGDIIVEKATYKIPGFQVCPVDYKTPMDIWEAEDSSDCIYEYELELEDEEFDIDRLFFKASSLNETEWENNFVITGVYYFTKKIEEEFVKELCELYGEYADDMKEQFASLTGHNTILEIIDIIGEDAANIGNIPEAQREEDENKRWKGIETLLEKIKLKAEEYDEPNCSEGSGIYSGLIINKKGSFPEHITICG